MVYSTQSFSDTSGMASPKVVNAWQIAGTSPLATTGRYDYHRETMALVYEEWRAGETLRGTVLTFWTVSGEGRSVPSPTILPDAYVEIVINLADRVTLLGPAFSGRQPSRVVVGLLDRAIPMRYGSR